MHHGSGVRKYFDLYIVANLLHFKIISILKTQHLWHNITNDLANHYICLGLLSSVLVSLWNYLYMLKFVRVQEPTIK